MARRNRWGITLPLHGLSLSAQREFVTALPVLGYTDAWTSELAGTDAFSPLVLASQWAPELRLGTAIAGIYTRAPVALAVSAGTLAQLAPGRFVLGLGTSSQVAVEQWNGIPFTRPLQRSRDMLRFLRAARAGQGGRRERRRGHPQLAGARGRAPGPLGGRRGRRAAGAGVRLPDHRHRRGPGRRPPGGGRVPDGAGLRGVPRV